MNERIRELAEQAGYKPLGTFADDKYELWYPRMGPGRGSKRYTELVSVRRFWLDPDQFESAVMFNVLEDKNGQLWLGEYVGD